MDIVLWALGTPEVTYIPLVCGVRMLSRSSRSYPNTLHNSVHIPDGVGLLWEPPIIIITVI